MKLLKDKFNGSLSVVLYIIAVVVLLLPFHAFLSVWTASIFGHYTIIRLWKEGLVFIAAIIAISWLITDKKVRQQVLSSKLAWLILAYVALDLILAVFAYKGKHVSGKALAYGLLIDLRFLGMFVIAWAAAVKSTVLNKDWQKLILWPAVIVILFGLLQMSILPANFLSHFGYGPKTIMPYETINNNPNYVRILSTLRGADPLGAYLILPISALAVLLIARFKAKRADYLRLLLLLGAVVVLYGSYSRAAWIGAVLAVAVVAGSLIRKEWILKYRNYLIASVITLSVIIVAGVVLLASSHSFQNIIYHTQSGSSASVSSNQAHLTALKDGISTVVHHPFGTGPGSSGPASVYNHYRPASIAENYFLTVGEESGWLGMGLFIAINSYVAVLLWQRRKSPFALTLLASFIGITFVNLLSIGWSDDTLSYIWWGLAGLCIATEPDVSKEKV